MYVSQLLHFPTVFQNVDLEVEEKKKLICH